MLVFRSVTLSLASMANVSIVVGLFFLIFAIMGVQLFGGRFWACNDTSVPNKVPSSPDFTLQQHPTSFANTTATIVLCYDDIVGLHSLLLGIGSLYIYYVGIRSRGQDRCGCHLCCCTLVT